MQAFHMTKDPKALSKQGGVATQSAGVALARSCFRLVQPRIRMLVGGHKLASRPNLRNGLAGEISCPDQQSEFSEFGCWWRPNTRQPTKCATMISVNEIMYVMCVRAVRMCQCPVDQHPNCIPLLRMPRRWPKAYRPTKLQQ